MKTMDLTQLNSPLMWLGCGLPVLFLLFLAGRTWKKSYKTGQEIGLEQSQLKAAIKTSAITAIGPSIACLAGMFAVMAIMGGPVAFMRLSFVGNSMFELMAAGFGAGATGIQVGVDKMTENGFMAALLVMILGSIPWVLFGTFASDKMDKIQNKIVKKVGRSILPVISTGALLGALGANNATYLTAIDKTTISCLLGAAIMAAACIIAKTKNIKWLSQWNLTIAIFPAMIITALL
ncbi:DUF5058 family protein [Clostridium sp. AF19-22AC]|mgnify:CR=1 FL=1|jgi:hypothetical protein|uniref:Uncharacterized protein DUF5058 n=1 Tax=Faecalicatena orotica TaxID=1544 RepID=A0A2Y9BEV7_9FIRM|nr:MULTISPECIES: DUF5058 family protein [Clostridia]PWJ28998.1 uncharacterized protein DUF5058 [Faecalicatena orotica]RHR33159.1 DUF5058 family protein [Clostridium sp. AF19-22AC]SSA56167.1 protein of unknown function [Faecalicatena orotica]